MAVYREDGSSSLIRQGNIYRETSGGGTQQVRVYREDSNGVLHLVHSPHPAELTITSNLDDCPNSAGLDLSWIPDTEQQVDIWRCQGSGCDPFNGVQIASNLSPGTDSYTDTGLTEDTTYVYAVTDNSGGTTEQGAATPICPT